MSSTCIFHAAKKRGERCEHNAVHDVPFCNSHRRGCNQPTSFFYDVLLFKGTLSSIGAKDIHECLSRLWGVHLPHSTTSTSTSISRSRKVHVERLDVAFIGIEILTYIYDHKDIASIAKQLRIPVRKHKMTAAFDIVYVMWTVWNLQNKAAFVEALSTAQKRWRARRIQKINEHRGPWPDTVAINDTDPFTMESLSDYISTTSRDAIFSFWENGKVYAFLGVEFYKYVFVHCYNTNPLTRLDIEETTKERLYEWWLARRATQTQNGHIAPIDPNQNQTPSTILTDVSSHLETGHNICIQPGWLLQLSEMDIMGVFSRYHQRMLEFGPHVPYMDRRAEEDAFVADDPGPSQIALGLEILHMLRCEQGPSFYVCNLIVVLSHFCPGLSASLPDWVRDAAEL